MKLFRRLVDTTTIQARLIKIGLVVTGTAALLIGVLMIAGVFFQQRARMLDDLAIQATITAQNSIAALSFKDKPSAADILAALKASPSIEGAAIYDSDGQQFATFIRKDHAALPRTTPILPKGFRASYSQLEVLVPIDFDGSRIGNIYLRSSLSGFYAYLMRYAAFSVLAALFSLAVATYLLTRLQRSVTAPLHTLSVLVEHVSILRDYAVRAAVSGKGEVAKLADGINIMLERIQKRDQDLEVEIGERKQVEENIRKLNETLEERVRLRSIELETERNFISSVLNMTSALVLVLARDGSIITANRAAQEACGFSQEKLARLSMWELFPAADEAERTRANFAAVTESGTPENFEGSWISPEKKRALISWHFSIVPGDSDATYNFIATGNDITNQKLVEETLQHAKQVAEQANRAKSEFLANMSHEIRTPMNAIMGMTHLTLQTDLTVKQRNYLEKVDSATKGLLGIINDILDFSKIEAGKMDFESVHFYLEDLMDNLADLSMMKAQEKGLALLFDIGMDVPTELIGDSLRLGQVLINLVNNAIKFTEKGEVTVAIRRVDDGIDQQPDQVQLHFSVTDTGIGLSDEQKNNLFVAFSQGDSTTTRKYGGTGLGLSISKNLVELMHGEIGLESKIGVGSTFFFTATFDIQEGYQHAFPNPNELSGTRVLVVDDNPNAGGLICAMLETFGYYATTVLDGTQALHQLELGQQGDQAFGLVLVDCQMNEANGMATIRQIRNHEGLKKIPACVMVTTYGRDEFLQKVHAEQVKIDGVLLKPVSPSKLLDCMLTAFGKSAGQRPVQSEISSPDTRNSLRGAYILLVEDNAMNREVAIDILSSAGIRVDVAHDGLQALERISQTDYDGVLMDCQMPVMGGFEAAKKIRSDSRYANLPIIAMTANAMSGDVENCVASGMNDHIAKPIDVGNLFSTMARWIKPSNPGNSIATPRPKKSTSTRSPSKAIKGLDTQAALSRMAGDVDLYHKMLLWFRQGEAHTVQRIRDALYENDRHTAQRLTHTLKGLSGNIGADNLFHVVKQFEQALKTQQGELALAFSNGSGELSNNLLDEIEAHMAVLLSDIDQALPQPSTHHLHQSSFLDISSNINVEKLAPQLKQLSQLLIENLSEATTQVDPIVAMLAGTSAEGDFRNIAQLIERYDFDAALGSLKEFASSVDVSLK